MNNLPKSLPSSVSVNMLWPSGKMTALTEWPNEWPQNSRWPNELPQWPEMSSSCWPA